MICDHRRLLLLQRDKQVAVRHEAKPLIPRIISWREVLIDVDIVAKLFLHHMKHLLFNLLRANAGLIIEKQLEQDIPPAGNAVSHLIRHNFPHKIGGFILGWSRNDIGRRALQHGDMLSLIRHRRHQRHSCGPRSDNHDFLARINEVLRPKLGMNEIALKSVFSGKFRRITFFIFIITTAHMQPVTSQCLLFPANLNINSPFGLRTVPA